MTLQSTEIIHSKYCGLVSYRETVLFMYNYSDYSPI